jgi:energy-coupling factor transporter transmembrane protein EcfT
MNLLTVFMIVGPIAILAGVAMMFVAIRGGGVGERPRSTVMLMAGMMLATFGLLLTIFATVGRAPVSQGA